MSLLESAELATYVVTVLGLPYALFLFVYEQRQARENDDEEIYERLTSAYTDFLKLVLEHPDLKLRSIRPAPDLDEDQADRRFAMFEILTSLFERAYLLTFEEGMTGNKLRRWQSWEDFMREWCRRADFRQALPDLLPGEDADFAAHIARLAAEEETRLRAAVPA